MSAEKEEIELYVLNLGRFRHCSLRDSWSLERRDFLSNSIVVLILKKLVEKVSFASLLEKIFATSSDQVLRGEV